MQDRPMSRHGRDQTSRIPTLRRELENPFEELVDLIQVMENPLQSDAPTPGQRPAPKRLVDLVHSNLVANPDPAINWVRLANIIIQNNSEYMELQSQRRPAHLRYMGTWKHAFEDNAILLLGLSVTIVNQQKSRRVGLKGSVLLEDNDEDASPWSPTSQTKTFDWEEIGENNDLPELSDWMVGVEEVTTEYNDENNNDNDNESEHEIEHESNDQDEQQTPSSFYMGANAPILDEEETISSAGDLLISVEIGQPAPSIGDESGLPSHPPSLHTAENIPMEKAAQGASGVKVGRTKKWVWKITKPLRRIRHAAYMYCRVL